ncbi:zinc finger 91-like [Olea europaea subsp. europaea]|uniref:Zinc finger 91-like n=1 Tax=Olea europaea subsp. europaea TaxID=158383 RepID=A0A8S0S120_OLEEU|nr:zinc finger 91-like [Olea europaea subsp. europaea]
MEVDQELRFVCKLCNKRYPCGKSLGGHMRAHVIANSAESEEKAEANLEKMMFLNDGGKNFIKESKAVELGNGQSSYGLRENPKKTWRAVDLTSPLPQEKVCKQCGKGFQSTKALCGHMACHSEKDRDLKYDHSWTSSKMVMDSNSDAEVEDRRLRTRSAKSKRNKNVVVKSSSFSLANSSSSVSEIDEQEQEDVALCLMMLARNSWNEGGVNSVVETSDNDSVILETKSSSIDMKICRKEFLDYVHNVDETPQTKKIGNRKSKAIALDADIAQMSNLDSGYFLDGCTKVDSDLSVDGHHRNSSSNDSKKLFTSIGARRVESAIGFRKNSYGVKHFETEQSKELTKENGYGMNSNSVKIHSRKREYISESRRMENGSSEVGNKTQMRSKYECLNCKKTFNSYQALGGHRPCHKRNNVSSEPHYETGENSLDDYALDSRTVKKSVGKNTSNYAEKKVKPKKNKVHVCPFCHKVYKNGQALGGHKRSHFIGGQWKNNNQTPEIKPKFPNLFDLNLPAPEEDEDDMLPIPSR